MEKFDTNKNGQIDSSEGKIVLNGGLDVATNLPLVTPLASTPKSTVVTPLTTIIAELVQQGTDLATAETSLKAALGLPSDVDLGSYDPLEAIAKGDAQGVSVFGSMIMVQNTIVQMAKFIDGVSETEVAQLAFSGISALANQTKSGTAVDLGNAGTIQAILTEAITKAAQSDPKINPTQLAAAAAAAAQVMALGNQMVKDLVVSGRPIKDIALEITKLQAVSVGQIAVGLPELAAGIVSVEQFLAENSKEAILSRMATVQVNDPTVRPEVKPIESSNPDTDTGTGNPDTGTGNPTLPFPRVEDTTTGTPIPTPGDDNLTYGTGDDTVVALAGNDTILGGDGNDLLFGNTGNDLINGQGGNDFIYGGKDQDTLIGELGNDTLCGDMGDDSLTGNDGDDALYGNQGKDLLDGGLGNDTLRGGKENDTLLGADGNDILCGDIGDDSLLGDTGNDILFGNQGNDFLDGGVGDNTLHGGKDNDTLVGNQGVDMLCGDMGNDSLGAGASNDMLFGNQGNDILDAGDGDDTLHGGQGDDTLIGGTGNDLLDGDFGNDILTGGAGNDRFVLELGAGADIITDFKIGEDSLVLTGGLSFQQLTITAGNNASLIRVGDELLATLNAVDSSLLNQQSFTLI
ncbi:hypothetical protein NG798_19390 [Ancylothrix sp. C2]|uniref:calcium-binding protein n=1 Tax=Ancylothrix sp. D3o TaxID=2953691 RepID=UPI0021BAADA9|nr:calcium-binding protein [Ancylothrix sp. D3o]MCT7951966.1 hypothetical protein [Ancylothrix sp. D3o]